MTNETMIERVARALYEHSRNGNPSRAAWGRATQAWRNLYIGDARAAIAALREPSPEMVEDGEDADLLAENVRQIWHAMIDAMLSEGDKP